MTGSERQDRQDEALSYLRRLSSGVMRSDREADSLLEEVAGLMSLAILRGETDMEPYITMFTDRLRSLEEDVMERGYALACERTGAERLPEVPAALYSSLAVAATIERYARILRDETMFFMESGYPAADLYIFLKDPKGYEGAHNRRLARMSGSVPDIHKGVSWKMRRNIYGMFIYSGMTVHNGALADAWGGMGMRGYVGFRTTLYNCPLCDSLCGIVRPLSDMVFPAHVHCVCGIIPVSFNDFL